MNGAAQQTPETVFDGLRRLADAQPWGAATKTRLMEIAARFHRKMEPPLGFGDIPDRDFPEGGGEAYLAGIEALAQVALTCAADCPLGSHRKYIWLNLAAELHLELTVTFGVDE